MTHAHSFACSILSVFCDTELFCVFLIAIDVSRLRILHGADRFVQLHVRMFYIAVVIHYAHHCSSTALHSLNLKGDVCICFCCAFTCRFVNF